MRIWRARWSLEYLNETNETRGLSNSLLEGQMRIWRARWSLEFPKGSQLPLEVSQVSNSPLEGQMRICSAR